MKTETDIMVAALSSNFYRYCEEKEREGFAHYYVDMLSSMQLEVETIEQAWADKSAWVEEQLLNIECEETYAAVSHDIITAMSEFTETVVLAGMDIPQADA